MTGSDDDLVCIHTVGRCFRTTREHADMFVHRVEDLILRGRPNLVPLFHSGGVEMLYITARTPLITHDVRDHSFDGEHSADYDADAAPA